MNQKDTSRSRVDVAGRLVRGVLDRITTAQEVACRGELDRARRELRLALGDVAEIERLICGIHDDLSRFEQLAYRA